MTALFAFIDSTSTGYIEYHQLSAALLVLCSGTLPVKLDFAIKTFSRGDQSVTLDELESFLLLIYKLALDTSTEILLDYPTEQLAHQVAEYAFLFNERNPITDTLNRQ